MTIYLVVEIDSDCHLSVEAGFTDEGKANAYKWALDAAERPSLNDYEVRSVELDMPHTDPAVLGFRAQVSDGEQPHVSGPIIVGRERPCSGRYDGGINKGTRYAQADGATAKKAIAEAFKRMAMVGPKIPPKGKQKK